MDKLGLHQCVLLNLTRMNVLNELSRINQMTTPANTGLTQSLLSGMTPKDCAKKYRCTIQNAWQMQRRLVQRGLLDPDKIPKSSKRISKHYDKIVEMNKQGFTPHQISMALKVRIDIVRNQIRISETIKLTKLNKVWRCKDHDSPNCHYCYSIELTGRPPIDPALDYISSNLQQ